MTLSMPNLGVAIVSFNSADVIIDCLESLLRAEGVALEIVVVDNSSTDDTLAVLREWLAGTLNWTPPADCPFSMTADRPAPEAGPHRITLHEAGVNGGFAAGVNIGLEILLAKSELKRFWVLNPDSMVPAASPAALATCPIPADSFSLMGARVVYYDHPDQIQIDGGTINRWTGVTSNLNMCASYPQTPPPRAEEIAFITGASLVASRTFIEKVGLMPEDYFLYYEEVDWALRRGDLPLIYCHEGVVYHRAGTAIGSPTIGRPASPFSLYFKHRARIRFVRRHFPLALPVALAFSVVKAAQLLLRGYHLEGVTILKASFGFGPSHLIRNSLSPEAATRAFAPWKG
ncbi:MAG: glycosyltransferase family 2 protein [Microgenomates group bacterium]